MNMNLYQDLARQTAVYPQVGGNPHYPLLGLCGEVGELANKAKKIYRDTPDPGNRKHWSQLREELGDVLWYVALLAYELGVSLEDIAYGNLEKLSARQRAGTLQGQGDHR